MGGISLNGRAASSARYGDKSRHVTSLTKGSDVKGWGKPVSVAGGSKRFMTPPLALLHYTTFGIRTPYMALMIYSPEATPESDTQRRPGAVVDASAERRLALELELLDLE
jgi:hypothetical protein